MRAFGICTEGLENDIEHYLRMVAAQFTAACYVEIGVAYGQTLCCSASILKDAGAKNWTAVGVDIPGVFDKHTPVMPENAKNYGVEMTIHRDISGIVRPAFNHVSMYFKGSPEFFVENWRWPIHYAFIDGCHGLPCVQADFLAVEQFIPIGGIAAFHDFGKDSVGEGGQHCPSGGNALGACIDLGLVGNTRKGWKHIKTVVGDKSKVGRDLGIFQRIA
jgi:hypothetical protein